MILGRANEVAYWVLEREAIRVKHDAGQPCLWTTDRILGTYRFCNVRREDDRVTRWLAKHWRNPHADDPNLTTAMLLARMINWPPTLEWLGYPEEFNANLILKRLASMPPAAKTWTSAYVITTCGKRMDKALYVVGGVVAACHAGGYRPTPGECLRAFWARLRGIDGLGAGFLAAQVVADLKYTPQLARAEDWWEWAVPGPGSRRGLNRYFGQRPDAPCGDDAWTDALAVMISEVQPLVEDTIGRIHAQDWQNVLCEWDKYVRTQEGSGRPKSRYTPEVSYQV